MLATTSLTFMRISTVRSSLAAQAVIASHSKWYGVPGIFRPSGIVIGQQAFFRMSMACAWTGFCSTPSVPKIGESSGIGAPKPTIFLTRVRALLNIAATRALDFRSV